MKPDILLVVDADPESAEMVAAAATKTRRRFVRVTSGREAFQMLNDGLDQVDVIVVDVDPGVHGMAVLEALDSSRQAPPVIVLTGLEETYMAPISAAHGAAACLAKPFSIERLTAVIEQVSASHGQSQAFTSDQWGHPHRCSAKWISYRGSCRVRALETFPVCETLT
jgi:DNA-binding response OmpR family regulator